MREIVGNIIRQAVDDLSALLKESPDQDPTQAAEHRHAALIAIANDVRRAGLESWMEREDLRRQAIPKNYDTKKEK